MNFSNIDIDNLVVTDLSREEEQEFWKWYFSNYNTKGEKRKLSIKEERKQLAIKANETKWNNMTPQHKKEIYEKIAEANKDKKHNIKNKEEWSNNIKQTWSNKTKQEKFEIGRKVSESVKASYSNLSDERKKQLSKIHRDGILNRTEQEKLITSNKIKQAYNNKTEQEKQYSIAKQKNTWKLKSQQELRDIMNRSHQTKKKNGSYGKSQLEEKFYNFCKKNNINIEWQYNKNGFSFDFIITINNKQTHIELNGVHWHNKKPFTNTQEDIQEYNKLVEKDGQFKNIANKWRYMDVNKYNYCVANNLNLIRIYYDKQFNNNLNLLLKIILDNCNKGIVTILEEDIKNYVI